MCEVTQKVAEYLIKEAKLHLNFILASRTKLLANSSSYHQITPLLDSNPLIKTLQLTNFNIQFPNSGEFIRALTETSRNWEMIDMSCNIQDSGCLKSQKCFISSKSTVQNLNMMYNNLSSALAAIIANMILNCDIKKINILYNKVQDSEVNNALGCLKQTCTNTLCVEIITSNSPMIIISDEIPKTLPSYYKIQLSIMHYHQPEYIEYILSHKIKLSQLIIQSNGLSLEQTKTIIKALPFTDLHIEESHICYESSFIDYPTPYSMTNLLKIAADDKVVSPCSSLILSLINTRNSNICTYNIKLLTLLNIFLQILLKYIQWS